MRFPSPPPYIIFFLISFPLSILQSFLQLLEKGKKRELSKVSFLFFSFFFFFSCFFLLTFLLLLLSCCGTKHLLSSHSNSVYLYLGVQWNSIKAWFTYDFFFFSCFLFCFDQTFSYFPFLNTAKDLLIENGDMLYQTQPTKVPTIRDIDVCSSFSLSLSFSFSFSLSLSLSLPLSLSLFLSLFLSLSLLFLNPFSFLILI